MTSEVFWNAGINSEEDLCIQDTFIMISSADFDSPPVQEDLDPFKVSILTAPRNIEQAMEAQSVAGGSGGAQNIQGEGSSPHPAAGEASTSGGGAGDSGGDDGNHGGGNASGGQAPVEDDESHEIHGTSSSSNGSGSVPPLIPPPNMPVPPQAVPWVTTPPPLPENRNGDHESGNQSSGSGGISDATTAFVSDTEGHGQIICSTTDPGPSTSKLSTIEDTAITAGCGLETVKAASDILDVSSAATSTLSSLTTSSSSGREDRKSVSSTDVSLRLDSSRLETAAGSELVSPLHGAHLQCAFEEKVAEFHMSQEDMFVGERYTSTPSATIEILGFSQPAASEPLDDDSDLIIPPSPGAFEVPFLFPSTPSEDSVKRILKRPLPEEFTSDDGGISRKKSGCEGQHTGGVGAPSSAFASSDLNQKKPSEKGLAAAKITRFITTRLDIQTSHNITSDEDETAASSQVTESVACKIAFESQTSDSQEGSSDPSRATRPSVPQFKPINKDVVSDSMSGDSNSDACAERPSTENLILSQLMENIANLEASASDTKRDGASSKEISDKLYRMKPKAGSSQISENDKALEKSSDEHTNLETNVPQTQELTVDSLKDSDPVLSADSCKEQQDAEEMQSDDELFLHYSPTQRMESQYFPLDDEMGTGEVAESDLDSESSISDANQSQAKEPLDLEVVPESETFESTSELTSVSKEKDPNQPKILADSQGVSKEKLPEGDLQLKTCSNIEDIQLSATEQNVNKQAEPTSFQLPTSLAVECLRNEPIKDESDRETEHVSQCLEGVAGPSDLQKQTSPSLYETRLSDDRNPFESTNDELDAPVCPVGRHKRPIVWTDDSVTREPEKQIKRMKTATKSTSCQVNFINESSTSSLTNSLVKSKDQAVQTIHDAVSKGVTQIVSEACDTTDSADIIRRTTIVTRTVIEEQLRHGKVIKKTVIETSDEPVVAEFPDDGNNEANDPLFAHPTPSKPSPESSISKSGTSSLTKSNSSLSHTSGWLGDISSSKSSSESSLYKATPMPSSCIASGDDASLRNQASTPMEPKSVSGMKTLRSVKRRQFYEFKKALDLSSPETSSPLKKSTAASGPGTKYNSSSSSSNEIAKVTLQSKPPNQRRKRIPKSPAAAEDSALTETPVKRPVKGKRGKSIAKMQLCLNESNNVAPKKTAKDEYSPRPSHDQEETLRPSTSRDVTVPASSLLHEAADALRPGARVMAKWQDKFYYPGRVLQKERDDSWLIMYDDGDARSIKVGKILVVDVLPVGQSVYAESVDGEFDSGIILENFTEDGETVYKVEFDSGTVGNVPRSKVCLTHDQAALLEELPTNTMHGYTSICLDNIVEGKRRSRGDCRETTPTLQRSPRVTRRSKKSSDSPPEGQLTSSSDEVSPSSRNKHGAKRR